jgi:hypothetical protein
MGALKGIAKDQKAGPNQGGYAYRGIEAITRQAQPSKRLRFSISS